MQFNIEDQLIKGFQFNTTEFNFNNEILLSEINIYTSIHGVSYDNGSLTIRDNILEGLFNLSSSTLELYIDNNKMLKLK